MLTGLGGVLSGLGVVLAGLGGVLVGLGVVLAGLGGVPVGLGGCADEPKKLLKTAFMIKKATSRIPIFKARFIAGLSIILTELNMSKTCEILSHKLFNIFFILYFHLEMPCIQTVQSQCPVQKLGFVAAVSNGCSPFLWRLPFLL